MSTNVTLSEGEYIVEVIATNVTTNDKEQIVVTLKLKIVEGPHAGLVIEKKYHFKNEPDNKAKAFFFKELARMGIDVKNSHDFEAKKEQLFGKRIRIEAVENEEGFMTYYVKGLAKDQEAAVQNAVIEW